MLTDAAPRRKSRELFGNSDRMKDLALPNDGRLQKIAASLEIAMTREAVEEVRRSCAEFLTVASEFYRVPVCSIRVLLILRIDFDGQTEHSNDHPKRKQSCH